MAVARSGYSSWIGSRRVNLVVVLILLTAIYLVAGKLGLRLATANPSATAVWPPTGIALAAVLLLGNRVWPAIFVGAFLVNVTTAAPVATSLGIAVGNTLEAVLGGYLVRRFASGRLTLVRAENLFRFILYAALFSTAVCATCGVLALTLSGLAGWNQFGEIWLTWWLGDMVGDLVVAPFILAWSLWRREGEAPGTPLEAVVLLGILIFAAMMVFGGLFPSGIQYYPLEFLCLPFLLWGAFRFGHRGAATSTLVLSVVAVWGTVQGLGPFAHYTASDSLLLLQAYVGVAAITTLMLAAVVAERRDVERRLRHLSVSDPLTGIGNYRQLIERLQAEIRRSERTGRPFAVLFLDLNGLKRINDRHGHMVGNRALCRVSEALQITSRTIDTPTRFGGDEFALVLPEADEESAWQVANRIAELLGGDAETPPLTVSQGVAVYPRDAATAEALLGAADQSLYGQKAHIRPGPSYSAPNPTAG